jgi:solute:Na+ symporter, SSS family
MEGQFDLATVDYAIVAAYIVFILGLGFWVGRGKKNTEEYFLGGRGAVWPIIGFALVAANFSGTHYIGLAGAGYEEGIMVWNFEWVATIVLVFFAFFIVPFYIRSRVSTVPEFLERRYDRKARYAFSGFTVFAAMLIDSAGALFAGAIVLQLLFPGVPLWFHVSVIALLGGIYVILGGLQAVMITDTIQGIILYLAGGIIFVILFAELDFSWAAIQELAPDDGWTVTPPTDHEFLPWPGIFTGVIWLSVYYWITNHVVVQKVLAARDLNQGRWGILFAGLMQLPFLIILILPGTMGRAVFPDIEDPDQIFPALAFEFMPVGVRGLILAALIAALMSTLDSVLNGAAALVTEDFVKTRDRQFSERTLLITGRVLVGLFMIGAALWAPILTGFPTIVEYFQSFLSWVTMPVVVIILGGIFWRRATRQAGFWTLATVAPVGFVGFLGAEIFDVFDLQFLYAAGLSLLVSLVVFVALSLMTTAPDPEEIRDYVWRRGLWKEESRELEDVPFWQNYRFLGIALLLLTLAVVLPFVN